MTEAAEATAAPAREARLYALVDWFIPAGLGDRTGTLRRARVFVIAHLLGPPLGHSICLLLWFVDPEPSPQVWVVSGLLAAFFAFPFLLRWTARLRVLALVTLQILICAILYSAYYYGGGASPLIGWLAVVPLLGIFYLGSDARLRVIVLLQVAASLALFQGAVIYAGPQPQHLSHAALAGLGVYSTFCTAFFVSMACFYYAGVLTVQQQDLEREIEQRRATERELRIAHERAEHASRAKSAFLANMSHELRTPLNAIIGFSEVMEGEFFGPHGHRRYRDYSRDIHASGRHLLKIINDILDLSKIEAGKAELDEDELIAIASVIDTVERIMGPQAERKGIVFLRVAVEPLPALRGSERMLDQVLLNLLSNAVKFTAPGGTVTLGVSLADDGGLVLSVTDSGIGMTGEEIGVAFAPFGQVDSALSRKYDGTGLGLPLAKALVELHGGSLTIISVPGKGTRVRAEFPAARVQWQPALAQAAG